MEMLLPDWEKKEMNVEKAKEKAEPRTRTASRLSLVRTSGLEPPTPCMSSKYSNQLSYAFISYRCNYYNRFARVCKESFCLFILSCNGMRLVLY